MRLYTVFGTLPRHRTVPRKKRRTISVPLLTDLTSRTSVTFAIEFVVTCFTAEVLMVFLIAGGLCAVVTVFPNHRVLNGREALSCFSGYLREFIGGS